MTSRLYGTTGSHSPALAKTANMWGALQGWPGGGYMFSKLVGLDEKYTGIEKELDAEVTKLLAQYEQKCAAL